MKPSKTHQKQVNIRLDDETLDRLDECRSDLRDQFPNIPTRSDVVRMAIEEFLERRGRDGHPPSESSTDR
ncbi:CopG family transcriptional regulator [Thioalkalivibrio sp. ALE11]|uniref:CopG family transcriptional regulator n=1 Tax=Thioalkalivibrio sp. ALE11 TaxID=1265494 RepID=UPI0003770514|nr:CopG family transcriptional regulator [Thioalkalivibrio sp. ALE11]